MHHSFLEYFAAIGLSRELEDIDLGTLVNEPRWREILTLLAGIIGESKDVTQQLTDFLSRDPWNMIWMLNCCSSRLIVHWNVKCLQSQQRLLAAKVKQCLYSGSGRLDSGSGLKLGSD